MKMRGVCKIEVQQEQFLNERPVQLGEGGEASTSYSDYTMYIHVHSMYGYIVINITSMDSIDYAL